MRPRIPTSLQGNHTLMWSQWKQASQQQSVSQPARQPFPYNWGIFPRAVHSNLSEVKMYPKNNSLVFSGCIFSSKMYHHHHCIYYGVKTNTITNVSGFSCDNWEKKSRENSRYIQELSVDRKTASSRSRLLPPLCCFLGFCSPIKL